MRTEKDGKKLQIGDLDSMRKERLIDEVDITSAVAISNVRSLHVKHLLNLLALESDFYRKKPLADLSLKSPRLSQPMEVQRLLDSCKHPEDY